MITFIILYFWNLILDYPLQGSFLAEYKAKNNYILWVHSAIWGIGMAIALMPFGFYADWKLIMLVGGHFCIDYWKCRGMYKKQNISDWNSLYIDQALHILQLVLCLI